MRKVQLAYYKFRILPVKRRESQLLLSAIERIAVRSLPHWDVPMVLHPASSDTTSASVAALGSDPQITCQTDSKNMRSGFFRISKKMWH